MQMKGDGFVVGAMTDALIRSYPKSCYFQATVIDRIYARTIQFLPLFVTNFVRAVLEFIVDRIIW